MCIPLHSVRSNLEIGGMGKNHQETKDVVLPLQGMPGMPSGGERDPGSISGGEDE